MPSDYTIPHASGIYKITCMPTGKFYIGSSISLYHRCREHFNSLQQRKHCNHKLQHAFDKYGPDAFIFEVIELVLIPFLIIQEQYWLDKLQPFGSKGFNIAPTAGSNLGLKHSPETCEKLRISHLGHPGYWTGKKRPDIGSKVGSALRGKPSPRYPGYTHNAEHREKLRQANLGKKASEEAKRNMSEAQQGRKQTPESIEKTRAANLGRRNSEEAINGMSTAHAREMKTLIVTSPEGVEYTIIGIHKFCKEHHLDRSTLLRVAKGLSNHHKGWTARFP